jgi:carboxyl-terminal processing protease
MKNYKNYLRIILILFVLTGLLACAPSKTPIESTPIVETPVPSTPTPTEIPEGHIVVTFDANVDFTVDRLIIPSGSTLETLEAPVFSNHIFVDYYADAEFTTFFDINQAVTEDTTVYLRFVEDTFANVVDLDIEFLELSLNGTVIDTLTYDFVTTGRFGSRITWTSQNNNLLTSRGYVIAPSVLDGPQEVEVRARVERGAANKNTFITFTIMPHVPLSEVTSSVELPFTNMTSEYEVTNNILKTYFLNDLVIPYVDVKTFLLMLDGLIETQDLEFVQNGNVLVISYIAEYTEEDEFGVEQPAFEEYSLTIDFDNGTISVETLNFFSGYIKSTATDYSEGLTYLDTYYEDGETVVFDLQKYRIDIMLYDDDGDIKFLLPFHLVNQLFVGSTYYNVYYNGDGYYGIYAVPSSSDTATAEARAAYTAIRSSSLNSTVIHPEISLQTLHMLAFAVDYFYGLKADREIESAYVLLERYTNNLVSGNTRRTSESIFEFLNKGLDDLHTSHRFSGMYEPASFNVLLTAITQVGNRVRDWYYAFWDVQDVVVAAYGAGQNPPDYRMIDGGKTAVIYLDGFYTATVDDPDGDDSNRFMREVMDAILLENPNVENIIVDLSYNTGGNLGALLRVLGYLTEKPIEMHYQNPTSNSRVSYFVEVETAAYEQINWFILTSRVTFSAANLMTSIAKQQGIATIIGTTSGGGASSITPVILPNGTFFTMSSLNVLSYRVGNDEDGWTYYSIENGVEPDYIVEVDDLHDDDVLAALINQINSEQSD